LPEQLTSWRLQLLSPGNVRTAVRLRLAVRRAVTASTSAMIEQALVLTAHVGTVNKKVAQLQEEVDLVEAVVPGLLVEGVPSS
jgi:hypothetical protein